MWDRALVRERLAIRREADIREARPSRTTLALLRAGAAVAVVFCVTATLLSARGQDWTFDEPDHLAYSRRMWETGETERSSHIHFNSKTPITVVNVLARQAAKRALGVEDQDVLRFITRIPTAVWVALLLASVWVTAWRVWDEVSAHIALIICAVEPNIIAHGSLATVDAAYALAALWVIVAAYAVGRRPTAVRFILLGTALGAAFVVKFTAFTLVPFVLLPFAAKPLRGSEPRRARGAAVALAGLTGAALLAALIVCAAYGFAQVGERLDATRWRSGPLIAVARAAPGLRPPLPLAFLTGIDISYTNERTKDWPVLILGQAHEGGVWYYFVFHWLIKTPLALLAAQLAGAWLLFRRGLNPMAIYLLVVVVGTLAYLSLGFRAQLGYRHALMLVPLVALLAAAGLAGLRRPALVGLTVLALAVGEQWPYLGDHLAFTNLFVWPKTRVWRVTGDSNVDYGQDSAKAEAWVREQREAHLDPPHIMPGRNVFGVTALYHPGRRWIREHLEPDGHFRFSHLYFDVDYATFLAYLDADRRLQQAASDVEACGPVPSGQDPTGAGIELPMPADGDDVTVLCVEAPQTTTFALRSEKGFLAFGQPEQRRKTWSWIGVGQTTWYRLVAGRHALVLLPLKGPYRGTVETNPPARVWLRKGRLSAGYLALPALRPAHGAGSVGPLLQNGFVAPRDATRRSMRALFTW